MHFLFKGMMIAFYLALASCLPAPRCPSTSQQEAQKSQQALTDFAINLFKNVSYQDPTKNQAVSPLSIALGLALVESGADGKTRDQIKRVLLEKNASQEDVLNVYVNLQEQLRINQDKTQLTIANGLFQDKDLHLKDDFVALIKNSFKSVVAQVDFQRQLEQTRQKVNEFISQKTLEKIPELYKQGDLTTSDRLVLANALYFKASWKNSFLQQFTKQGTFYGNGREAQTVPFMHQLATLRHSESDDADALELPYDDQDLSMIVVLPKTRDGMRDLEKKLTGQQLRDILSRLQRKQVEVQLPKFQVRSHLDLKKVLSKMGLESLFGQEADFRRMSETALKIDNGVHEAYISVDENGTEGAAATAFAFEEKDSIGHEDPPTPFKGDHPFLYAVVHKQTGAIVFLGKVNLIDKQK